MLAICQIWLAPIICSASPPVKGPFYFCYGMDQPDNISMLKELGLNTLYLRVKPQDSADLQALRLHIQKAQQQGLHVIVELPTCLTAAYRVSADDEHYTKSVQELLTHIIQNLKQEPGLTAWATGSWLERYLNFSDADFRRFLQRRYGSLEQLCESWGTQIPTWMTVTMAQARELESQAPYQIGRAAIDWADYRAEAYKRVMQHWLAVIRQNDATRPVFTGRVTLYRSLVSIPEGYDVVCVSMPPDILENDWLAHNPQALDIARRGGRFRVLPVFRIPDNASPAYAAGSLYDWAQHAALHGAMGFGLEDWEALQPFYALESRLPERSQRLMNAIRKATQGSYDFQPQATIGVIYSPYASGFEVTRQPVYGYLLDYLPGEPSLLVWALRLGTRFGLVDYLSLEDLQRASLEQYGCLLAPACLNLSVVTAGLLEEYVRQGGALLADLGLGAYQTRSWTQLPPVLQEAFGILELSHLQQRAGELTAAIGLPALSPWPRGAKANGLFQPQSGGPAPATERRSYPVSGWLAEGLLMDDAAPVASISVRFDEEKKPRFSGLVGREYGAGLAIFAMHPLWQYWPLTDPLCQILHERLMARRAAYELRQDGLLQSGPFFGHSTKKIAIFNPEKESTLVSFYAYNAHNLAYTGCASRFLAAPGQCGLKPGTAWLVAQAPPRQTIYLSQSALIVQPYAQEATVLLQQYDLQAACWQIAGANCEIAATPRGLQLRGGEPVSVRLILASGDYPVRPYSQHRLHIKFRSREIQKLITADAKGELDLSSDIAAACTFTVTPTNISPEEK